MRSRPLHRQLAAAGRRRVAFFVLPPGAGLEETLADPAAPERADLALGEPGLASAPAAPAAYAAELPPSA